MYKKGTKIVHILLYSKSSVEVETRIKVEMNAP